MALTPPSGRGPSPKALEQQRIIANLQTASDRVPFQRRLSVSLGEVSTVDRRTWAAARQEDFGTLPASPLPPPLLTLIVPVAPSPAVATPVTPATGTVVPSLSPPTTPSPIAASPVGPSQATRMTGGRSGGSKAGYYLDAIDYDTRTDEDRTKVNGTVGSGLTRSFSNNNKSDKEDRTQEWS